jgi:hypothetical protein
MGAMFSNVLNTAGECEREVRSRRANALDGLGVACGVLLVVWPFCFGWGVLGHTPWVSSACLWALRLAFFWAVLGSPLWHRDAAGSLGLGGPSQIYRLLHERRGFARWRVALLFLAVFGGIVWFGLADWPDAARFFRLPRQLRMWPASPAHWAAVSIFTVTCAALLATYTIRYDNFGSAFGLALKISAAFLTYATLAAWLQRGDKAFAKFELQSHSLDAAAHMFWGLIQQLIFTGYFATRLRKAFGPSARPENVIPAGKRLLVAGLGGLAAAATIGLGVWIALRTIYGPLVPLALLAGCLAFAFPVGAVWTHFFCRDKKRVLVATLSGSFFGLIHVDSYGLVLLTAILGTSFAYAAMEDRFRNLAAFAFVHGLLGATVAKLFGNKGILGISYSVGPWAVKDPSAAVLVIPILCLAIYVAVTVWAARRLPRDEGEASPTPKLEVPRAVLD